MAQIIGQNPDFNAECRRCGTQFSFVRDEVRAGDKVDYDTHQGYVICPGKDCGHGVVVKQTVSTETAAQQRRDDDY